MDKQETLDRLNEISVEIKERIDEAMMLLKDADALSPMFEAYTRTAIVAAIDDTEYPGACQYTLGDAIEALEEDED